MIIKTENLVKRYGDYLALDNLSLTINQGDILGLLGPNGAGKTTFINCLIGLTTYEKGDITIFGKEFKKNAEQIKGNLGIVPQDLALYMDLSAYDNVLYFGSLYGIKGSELKNNVKEALEFVDLWDRRKEKPRKFSGGMKRRLNIACALVHKPKIVIMDEPTVGIDPQSRNHILQSVKELNKNGTTIIYTCHYMEEVESICNTIAIIDYGRLIACGEQSKLQQLIQKDKILEIEVSEASYQLTESLKKTDGVKDVITQGRIMTLRLDHKVAGVEELLTCIRTCGVDILAINLKKASLEDVFLTLTGRTLRD